MRLRHIVPLAPLILASCGGPPPVNIQAEPSTARIYRVAQAGDTLLGTGTGSVKAPDENAPATILVSAEGYEPVRRSVTKADADKKAPIRVRLTRRVVHLTTMPNDADIVVEDVPTARKSFDVRLDSGESKTVEVRKPGFRTITRTYANRPGTEAPPASETINLTERDVLLNVSPSGAQVSVGGKNIGEGTAHVIIGKGTCTTVRAAKRSYVAIEKTYCQQDGVQEPPLRDVIELRDREVAVTVEPNTAAIKVSGKQVGLGEYPVTVRRGACVEMTASAASFLPTTRTYCNEDNSKITAVENGEDFIKLRADESWPLTVESDQANVNFQVDVGATRKPEDAWRILNQIITSQFDVLEITDKETGYLRTGWNIRTFDGSVIRTRVIVKLASGSPLKYTVKLVSEKAVGEKVDIKDDQLFKAENRILMQYKDLINEIQTRLR